MRESFTSTAPTFVYPMLGGVWDLGIGRVSGVGLGNAFFNYFHALRVAEEQGATVIYPGWPSLKIGPFLRRQRSKRLYLGFRPMVGMVSGASKMLSLATFLPTAKRLSVDPFGSAPLAEGQLNLVRSASFAFGLLKERRDVVRDHLVAIADVPITPRWGQEPFIAVHVRLGEFRTPSHPVSLRSGSNNRIPLDWYVTVVRRLMRRHPDRPVLVFSDGEDHELAALFLTGARRAPRGSDIQELITLARASLLIGSNSTFSRWAAFLGNMSTIWLETETQEEVASDPLVPIAFVALDGSGDLAPVLAP